MNKLVRTFALITLFFNSSLLFLSCTKTDNGNTSTVTTVPFPPTDLAATVVSTTQVNLNWIDKSTNEVGFKLERKTPTTNFAVIASLGADITSYSDNGLTPNATYTYRVYTYNSVGASPTYSNEVTITTIGLPNLTTTAVSNFTAIDGVSGGTITTDGGAPVTARGVVWSISQNPTIALSTKTTDGSGTGIFTSTITGLTASTKYYVRAYATNAAGTAYGNEVSFTTNNIDITTGLLAYYPFSGNANNALGNGNNGTVFNASLVTDRFGNPNSAYSFNGVDAYIDFGSNDLIGPTTTIPISISFWVSGNAKGNIISKYTNLNASKSYFLFSRSSSDYAWIGNGTVPYIRNTLAPDNDWTHYVLVGVSGVNKSKVYRNGTLIATGTLAINSTISPVSLIVGKVIDPVPGFLNGRVDEIRIYNQELTQDAITYLSNQ